MSQTYRCECGQTNVNWARHCGRAGCQLPNPDPQERPEPPADPELPAPDQEQES